MPKGTRVHRCVEKLVEQGMEKEHAIPMCQKQTGQNYKTGEKLKRKRGKKDD